MMADLSPQDLDTVTRTVLSEAGQDGDPGMTGVAAVIKNRLDSGQYGSSPTAVVQAPNQFSAWSLPPKDQNSPTRWSSSDPQYQRAAAIVNSVWSGKTPDPTGGADHYLNPQIVTAKKGSLPSWAAGQPTAQIGGHSFYSVTPPDLLGSWAAPTSAPVTPANASAQSEPDLLGSWAAGTPGPDPSKPPTARITIYPKDAVPPPGQETPAQWTNRVLSEHQGDSLEDKAIRLGIGGLRGVGDVADTIGEGIAGAGSAGAGALQSVGAISPQTAGTVQNWSNNVDQRIAAARNNFTALAANSPLAQAGRIGGQVAGTAPLLAGGAAALEGATGIGTAMAGRPLVASIAAGAGAGAGAAALTSAASDEPLGSQVLQGAESGAALGPIGYGASRLGAGVRSALFGTISPDTAQLAQTARNTYGIPVSAGQMSGNPMVRFADSVLQRIPFTGYGARTDAQRGAFNRAVSNTFGEDAESITPQVIEHAEDRIGNMFDSVAQRTPTIQADAPFFQRFGNILNDARSVVPDSEIRPLENQMRDILSAIDPQTHSFSGETYQALTRKGAPLDRSVQSSDPNIRFYAAQMRDALDDAMQRSAPQDAVQDLIEARRQWKALKTVSPLADKAPTGDISPALLQGAANKSYTQNRNSDLRQLGRVGQRFLKEPPSSGTSERLLAMGLGGTALGALGYGDYKFDPENFQRNALLGGAALLGGRAASSALRSGWLANSLIRSGLPNVGAGQPLAQFLSRAAPVAALTYRGSNGLTGQ